MIRELSLDNFKLWKSIKAMRLAPITGLFGTNSSGKSSILQLLLMLKQTAESSDRKQALNFGGGSDYVRLGSFRDVVFQHDKNQTIQIKLKWQLAKTISIQNPLVKQKREEVLFSGKEIIFETNVGQDDKDNLVVRRMAYSFGLNEFSFEQDKNNVQNYILDASSLDGGFSFTKIQGRPWPLKEPPTKCYGFPDQVNAYYQNAGFLSDLELEFEQMLRRIYYLAPLREFPERDYRWSGGEPTDVGRRGERLVDALLAGSARGRTISPGYRKKKQTIEERVAYWLRELGLITSFSVKRIANDSNLYEVRVVRKQGGPEVLLPDVGFGVSQVLPVLVLCYYAPEGSTLLFEQPEIHLHPSVQAGLADVFIDVAKNRNLQIILESHSEHLLNRLQRRIAEETVPREDIALYFCETNGDAAKLRQLQTDPYGNIENWPKNFFGDRFGESAARQEAALRHQLTEDGDKS